MKKNSLLGFSLVILAGMGFGFLGIFGKLAFQSGMSVGELLTSRFILATVILWTLLLCFKRSLVVLPLKQIIVSSLLGVFGYAVFSTLYFKSIQGLSVSLAAILLFTFPIFVNIGAYFLFKQKFTRGQVLGLILSFIGIVILLWSPVVLNSVESVIYALLAAITYAIYVLASGHYQKDVHAMSSSLYVITSAAVALCAFHQPSFNSILNFNFNQVSYVLGLSIICTIFPLTFFLMGIQKLDSSKASIFVTAEPIVAALAGWVILGETISFYQMIGALLVLASFMLV